MKLEILDLFIELACPSNGPAQKEDIDRVVDFMLENDIDNISGALFNI